MSTLAGRIASANAARLGTAATTARQAADYIVESRNEEKNKGGILGGIGYTVEKLGLGILSSVEGIWDFVAGGIAKLLGADEWAEKQISTDLVDYNHADEWYNPSDAMKVVGDVAGGIGTSLPAIGSVIIAGGISGGTLTPLAAGLVSGATAGLGAAGRATKEAYDQTGQLGGKEFGYGALSGITEAGVEGVSSLVGMGSGQVVKGLAKSFGKQIATGAARETLGKSLIKGFVGEAFEEGLSELITPVWQRLTYDPNAKNATAQEVGYAALIGGLSGAIMGGADVSIRNSAGLVRGHRLVTEGKSDAVIQTAENLSAYEEENQTGFEAFESVKGALEELKTSMEKTGGQITTPRQKMLLGTLERANTCAAFTPFVMASAENIATNADSMVQRLSAYTDEKGQTFSYTAEQLREGLDFSSPKALRRSFAKALKKNQALRTLAVADATGRLLLDTNAYAQGMLNGQTPVSAVRWNEFIERASDREKQAIAQEFGIENLDAVTVEEVQSKMQAYFDNGGAERIRSDNALKKTLAALPEEKAKKRISADGIKEGTTRYRIGNDDFAVVKKDEQYRIYDYESGMLSKTLTKDEFGKVVEQLNNAAEKSNTAPKNDTRTDGSLGKPIKIRYALMNEKSFADNVKEILSMSDAVAIRNKNLGNYISVMKGTPAVITENVAGAENLEIIIRFDSLYLAARESGALQGNYHALGEEVVSNLPQYISNPDAIVRLDNGRINLFTQIETKSGKNGIVSVELGAAKDINSKNAKYNLVISAFGAKDNYVKNIIKRDGTSVEYMKKDLSQVNPQLYEWLSTVNERSNTIISENSEMSTGKEKISEEVRKSSANELDAYARENIEGYNKIGAANQRMIRSIIRQGRANGIAETDILSYARVATHTGVNIVFNKGLCAIAKEDTGEIIYSDGYNDEQNNRFVVNPESKRTAESLLIHEFSHTLFRTKGGRALLKLALKNMSVEDQKEIVARYRAAGRTNPVELLDEISAHYAEGILSSEKMLDRLLADKPNARKSFLAFSKRAKTEYSADEQLSREAERLYKQYKKWFDKFSAANTLSNARENTEARRTAWRGNSPQAAEEGARTALPKDIIEYSDEERASIERDPHFVVANSLSDAIEFFSRAARGEQGDKITMFVGKFSTQTAAKVKKATGISVFNKSIALNRSELRHIENNHGVANPMESKRGQIPITAENFAQVIEAIASPDSVTAETNEKSGTTSIVFTKSNGGETIAVTILSEKKKTLTLKSAWIINKKRSTSLTPDAEAPRSTSETGQRIKTTSDNSIARNSEMSTDSSRKNGNRRYALAGERSATADSSLLARAREMQTEGYDSEEIRQETGWFIGLDGKWRYEVDDSVMKPIEGAKFERHTSELGDYRTAKLGEVIRHDKLFEAYPQLKDITLIVQETSVANQGSAFLRDNQIVLNEDLFKRPSEEYQRFEESKKAEIEQIEQTREFKDYNKFYEDESLQKKLSAEEWLEQEETARNKFFSSELGKRYHELMWGKSPVQRTEFGWTDMSKAVLIHEIQHFIQSYEGFAQGSSEEYWIKRLNQEYKTAYDNANERLEKIRSQLSNEAKTEIVALKDMTFDERYNERDLYKQLDKMDKYINEEQAQVLLDYVEAYNDLWRFRKNSNRTAMSYYEDTAGEIEARDAAKRLELTAEERKNKRPDIDRKKVYFASGKDNLRYALPAEKITADMTDDERYQALKDRTITLVAADNTKLESAKKKLQGLEEEINFSSLNRQSKLRLLRKLGEEFGVYKTYGNADISLSFEYSKKNLKESVHKQGRNYDSFAKMLTCFDGVVENAVGIEMHNRNAEGYKPDPTLKNVYVLASAFEDGDRITPVKLEVKEFSDKENTLYVAVALESIKTDRIVPTGSSTEGGVAQISPLPVTISISELLRNVNPSDKNFYKYIPKKFFDGENGGIRYALPDPDKGASAVEQAQVYANNARMRVYSVKDSAETVQRALEMLNMDSGWKYISLKGKSRAQVIRSLTVAFNKAEPNERATLAAEFADYIIDSAIVENLYEGDMEMEARNVLELLRPYLHAFDLHGIQGEIRHRYDKRNNINLMWGQKKGGVAPDVVAQELAQYGFHIEAENEAEIFFEIVDRYEEARRTLRDVVKKERAADYVTPEQRDEIIADILHDFETGGEETRHARLLKYYKKRIDALSKKLREARIRNNYTNQIVDGVSKLRSYLKREYEPSSVWQAPELRAWVKQASRLSTRTDLRKRGVRKLFADLRAFYNTSNPLLYSEDAMLSHYDQNVADALELLASNAESNKPLTIEELRAASVVVASLNHLYRTYDTILVRGRQTSLTEYAKRGVASLKRNVYSHVGKGILNTGYDFKNLVVDARSVFRNLDGYAESVLTELYQDLCDAETTQSLTEIELRRDLDAYLKKNRKYKRRLQHDHVQIGDATLTIDQAISLYELSKREQAQEGLKQAGYSYVDEKNVKHTATFTGIDEKIFTKEDWEFIALVEQFFNVKSSETKRRADMNIMGYTNVQDAFYFPIARDDGTIARNVTDPGSASRDIASVYNFSFNKDVKKGARSKLFVGAVTSIVGRHAQQLAQYSALTLPLKNFAQVYAKNVGTVTNVESLKTILNEKIWDKTDSYLRKFFDDMQGKGRRAPTLLRRVRSAYAKYQLGFNLKVFLSQITSYPTAGVVLDFDVLVRAFTMKSKKGFFAELDRYCPYARARAYQRGIVRAEGLVDHIGKIGDALTKPIQWTDRLTIGMLWKASQLQVLKNDGYELGTEANLQAAGKLLEKVIRETQPNYTTTERSALMRSDSDILASFTMFTSVPLKQLSRLVDAVGEWRTLSRKARFGTATDAELARLKASRKKLGRVIAAVTVANICYVLVGQAIKSLYAKDRKDKDGNEIPVWEDILLDFSATTIGMLPFAKDIYGYFVNDYDFNNFAFDTVDNLLGASQELFGLVTDAAQGKPVEQTQYMRALRSSLYSIGQMTGIPVRNLNNTVVGLVRRFSSANGYRYDSLFYTDSYAADLKQALEKGDEKLADAIMDLAVGKNGAGELSAAGRKKLIDLYRAGYSVLPRSIGEKITVNGEQKEVSAAEQKRIFSAYSAASARVDALIVSPVFEKLSEEDQAKAIKNIFDASYNEAIGNASGARLLMFEKTNAFADIIAAICGAKAVEGQKDKEGKTIAGSKKQAVIQYLNSLNLTRAQCILVLRYLGYTLSNGEFCNMSAAQVNITLLNYLRSCGFSNEERAYFSTAA